MNRIRPNKNLLVSSPSFHLLFAMSHVCSIRSPVACYRILYYVCGIQFVYCLLDICHLTNFRLTTWHFILFERKLPSDWKLKERTDGIGCWMSVNFCYSFHFDFQFHEPADPLIGWHKPRRRATSIWQRHPNTING